jgi:hypothetical protein
LPVIHIGDTPKRRASALICRTFSTRRPDSTPRDGPLAVDFRQAGLRQPVLLHQEAEHAHGIGVS